MKKLNRKGFTLVEVLAVVIILGILIAIMVPTVNNLINKNKENNAKQLVTSIKSAAKMYISDYKYKITLASNTCSASNTIDIANINDTDLPNPSQIPISILIDEGNLTTSKDGNIYNPEDKEQKLNLSASYIFVQYNCQTKDYIYNDPVLNWE